MAANPTHGSLSTLAYIISIIIIIIHHGHALRGFDISLEQCDATYNTAAAWNCLRNEGFGFAVIEAVQGGHNVTADIVACVKSAATAGFALSLYGWFCPVCRGQEDPYYTGRNAIQTLRAQGLESGRDYLYFYIDVEDCDPDDDCWLSAKENQDYVLSLAAGVQAAGASAAIYASPYEWNKVMGDAGWKSNLSSLPLWYPSWNNAPDMSGFTAFGGWTVPHMHQYADTNKGSSCDTDIDLDYIDG